MAAQGIRASRQPFEAVRVYRKQSPTFAVKKIKVIEIVTNTVSSLDEYNTAIYRHTCAEECKLALRKLHTKPQ